MNSERGARVDPEMLGGEKERMRESVVAGLDPEFQMPVLKANAEIMLGAVPRADIGFERLCERVLGVGIARMLAKPDRG